MQQNKSIVFTVYTKFLMQFIVAFCIYVLLFGEITPGGGFQAGAILISALIGYDLSCDNINKFLTTRIFILAAISGLVIYGTTGLMSLFYGKNFLDYSVLAQEGARVIGINMIELGIALTVSSSLGLIYMELKNAI
ncbi:MAG: MnhB domain-containing protein [Rickettsiaceae bacterium]|nr:MnhB domain-containing protein [Rickettsiaceae bacterium]